MVFAKFHVAKYVQFKVLAQGRKLQDSPLLKSTDAKNLDVLSLVHT